MKPIENYLIYTYLKILYHETRTNRRKIFVLERGLGRKWTNWRRKKRVWKKRKKTKVSLLIIKFSVLSIFLFFSIEVPSVIQINFIFLIFFILIISFSYQHIYSWLRRKIKKNDVTDLSFKCSVIKVKNVFKNFLYS